MGKLLKAAINAEYGKRRPNLLITREEAELIVAWLHGQVTTKQAAQAIGINPAYAHSMLSQWLVKAVRLRFVSVRLEAKNGK